MSQTVVLEGYVAVAIIDGEKQILTYCEGYEVYNNIPYSPVNVVDNLFSDLVSQETRNVEMQEMCEYFPAAEWERVKVTISVD